MNDDTPKRMIPHPEMPFTIGGRLLTQIETQSLHATIIRMITYKDLQEQEAPVSQYDENMRINLLNILGYMK